MVIKYLLAATIPYKLIFKCLTDLVYQFLKQTSAVIIAVNETAAKKWQIQAEKHGNPIAKKISLFEII